MNLGRTHQQCLLLCACLMFGAVVSLEQQCVKSRFQKSKPGPENLTNTVCSAYSSKSCCNTTVAGNITRMLNDSSLAWLNLRWDHCGNLSARCQALFVQDLCFYECSPNMGPWIVAETKSKGARKERFRDVPLCRSQCDEWYDACKDDMTCTDNWTEAFDWKNGTNHCPKDSQCRPFREVFQGDPKTFCEKIFAGSFKYVYDSQPCYAFGFTPAQADQNDQVELWQRGVQRSGAAAPAFLFIVLAAAQWLATATSITA